MKHFIFILGLYLISVLAFASDELKCSLKGTKIYTVNGVFANNKGALAIKDAVDKVIVKSNIDKSRIITVREILNNSHGLGNDALELLAQNLRARGITDDPWKYIGAVLSGVPLSNVGLLALNSATLSFLKEDMGRALYSPEQLAKADEVVVNSVKGYVKNSLDKKEKVIIVAHSQGNSVTNASMEILKRDSNFNKDYRPYLGVLHVATPVNYRAIANNDLIKLNNDLVVSNYLLLPFSESPNYVVAGFTENNPLHNFFSFFLSDNKDVTFHGMTEIYLSSELRAYPRGTSDEPKLMTEIFNDKMHGIAKRLEDNCFLPNIKITSSEAVLNAMGQLEIEGYARAGRLVRVKVEDVAGDSNNDNVDENGYDRKKTKFTYKLTVSYPSDVDRPANITVGELFVNNEGYAELELAIPYRDFGYKLVVTAINQFEKESTKSMEFIVPANQKLQAQLSSKACYVDQYGYNPDGKIFWEVSVNDDEYLFDNKKYKKSSDLRSIEDSYYDSEHVAKLTIVNDCEISKWPLTYEVWATCQNTHCSVLLGLGCGDYYVNTGFQWNELRIYDMFGNWVNRKELAGGAYGHSVVGGFVDPNDGVTLVSFPTAEACPTAQESKEPQTFKIQ